jgi:hypothetical protein
MGDSSVVFDFDLNVRLSSSPKSHKGELTMSWVNDEAEKAKRSDEDRNRREKAYEQQMWGLWNVLKAQITNDVEEINQNQELVGRRLGGAKLELSDARSQG